MLCCVCKNIWLTVSCVECMRYGIIFENLRKRIVVYVYQMSSDHLWRRRLSITIAITSFPFCFHFFGATMRNLLSSFKCWSDMRNVFSNNGPFSKCLWLWLWLDFSLFISLFAHVLSYLISYSIFIIYNQIKINIKSQLTQSKKRKRIFDLYIK